MTDRITANLPARDFAATALFYGRSGFVQDDADDGWMILSRGPLELEFFPHPELLPQKSWFSACIRVNDPDSLLRQWQEIRLPKVAGAIPRLTDFFKPGEGPRIFARVDLDGSLLRVIDNRD